MNLIKSSFDYKPLETEYTNNNSSSIKLYPKNLIDCFNKEKLENIECSSIKLDSQIIHIPMKIKDNLDTKKEHSNSIDSLNLSNNIFVSPPKFLNKPKNFEFFQDIFNSSSTENKKIMVSDLDISIETPTSKTQRKNPQIIIHNNKDDDDFKKELKKNLIAFLEKNQSNKHQTTENREIKEKFYTENNNNKNNNKNKHYNNIKKNNNLKTEKKREKNNKNNILSTIENNYLCLTIMNGSSLKPFSKNKSIYKKMKNQNNKKCNVYKFVKEITENNFYTKIKNKNLQRANSSKLKRKSTKKSLVSNNSLTNCSSTCTHKGGNFPIYYNINSDYKNEIKKNIPKTVVKIHSSYNNKNNHIHKTYSIENNLNEKFISHKNFYNIKKVNNSNSHGKNKKNSLQKEKKNLIYNIYDSYLGNNQIKQILPKKFSNLITSQSKKKIFSYEKKTIKGKNFQSKSNQKSKNLKKMNRDNKKSMTLKLFNKKIIDDLNNKRLDTDSSLIEKGKNLSEKYSFLLKGKKFK
jgi:hypothetical protein